MVPSSLDFGASTSAGKRCQQPREGKQRVAAPEVKKRRMIPSRRRREAESVTIEEKSIETIRLFLTSGLEICWSPVPGEWVDRQVDWNSPTSRPQRRNGELKSQFVVFWIIVSCACVAPVRTTFLYCPRCWRVISY